MLLSRFSVKLFLVYATLNIGLAVVFVSFVAAWQRRLVLQQVEARLHDVAVIVRSHVRELLDDADGPRLQELVEALARQTGIRLTIVQLNGDVIADSEEDPLLMDNHRTRPELLQAAAEGQGESQRFSDTVHINMFYYALRLDQAEEPRALVRVSLPLTDIDRQVAGLHQLLWASAAVVGVIALALTMLLAGRMIRPLTQLTRAAESVAAGNYDLRISVPRNDELGMLANAVNSMRRELTRQVQQQRENSEMLETVFSSMQEGVLAVDAERRVLLANETSRKLLNIESRDVMGRPLLEVTRNRNIREAVEQAFAGTEPCESEFETLTPPRWQLALRAMRLPGDPPPAVVVVLYDVTELRRLENMRRDFVANVSHELKTPLSAVKAYAETLRLGAIRDEEHNVLFVERIEEQADRLHQLIIDLLHLARVESGKEALDIRDVSITDVVCDQRENYEELTQAKGQRLSVSLPDGPAVARADRAGVVTILDNLVSNAIQYTVEGGQVQIRLSELPDWIELVVEDNGIGIAEKDQQRIFERFYRVDKARSRELGGTGLGLAIVKHLTHALRGEVGLRSEVGEGSVFWVRLPRAG